MMIPTMAWRWIAVAGVRWVGWTVPKAAGRSRDRPSAKIERVDALAPEFALARQLLRIANVTSRLPMPGRTCSAMPPQGLPELALMKSAILSGPK